MTSSKKGFASNRELAKKFGKINGAKSKGRKLTDEHRARISASQRKRLAAKIQT